MVIIKDGKVVEIIIKSVRGRVPLPAKILRDFEEFVNTYSKKIVQKWIDYFVLHKNISCEKVERIKR